MFFLFRVIGYFLFLIAKKRESTLTTTNFEVKLHFNASVACKYFLNQDGFIKFCPPPKTNLKCRIDFFRSGIFYWPFRTVFVHNAHPLYIAKMHHPCAFCFAPPCYIADVTPCYIVMQHPVTSG